MNIYTKSLTSAYRRANDLGLSVCLEKMPFSCIQVTVKYSEECPDILLDMFYSVFPEEKYASRDLDRVCDHIQQMIHTNAGVYQ